MNLQAFFSKKMHKKIKLFCATFTNLKTICAIFTKKTAEMLFICAIFLQENCNLAIRYFAQKQKKIFVQIAEIIVKFLTILLLGYVNTLMY